MTGASTAGTITFWTTAVPLTAPAPAAASVAPTTPPISACDELDGSPMSHVITFQAIAPSRPAKTTVSVIAPESTMPLAMVFATSRERKAPTTLRRAARPTATRGRRAPVAMDEAVAFPVSWKPLVKSNASAVAMTTIRMRSSAIRREGNLDDTLVARARHRFHRLVTIHAAGGSGARGSRALGGAVDGAGIAP